MKTKKLLLLSAASVLLLSGCAKEITAVDAKKHADEHYSLEEANAKYSGGKVTTVTKTTKSEGLFEKLYPLGEKTEGPTSVSVTSTGIITSNDIDEKDSEYKYFLDGNSLSAESVLTGEKLALALGLESGSESVKGELKSSWKVNEVGLPVKIEVYINAEVNYSVGGISVTGAIDYSNVTTYTWEAK